MVAIRQFRPEDAPAVRRLFVEGQRQFHAGIEEDVEAFIQESLQGDLADIPIHYLSEPGSCFWVAEAEGRVIGTAGLQRRSADLAELRRMNIDIGWRRKGIARRMLEEAEAFAVRQGYSTICLSTVTVLRPAISLYEQSGYELTGKSKYGAATVLHFSKDLVNCPNIEGG